MASSATPKLTSLSRALATVPEDRGQHLADLVRREGLAGELAQVLLDQFAQPAGPDGQGAPAALGGLEDPPSLADLLPHNFHAGQGRLQIPAERALPAASAACTIAMVFPAAPAITAGIRLLGPAPFCPQRRSRRAAAPEL